MLQDVSCLIKKCVAIYIFHQSLSVRNASQDNIKSSTNIVYVVNMYV